jgi:predicted component of type VI protein secretion system
MVVMAQERESAMLILQQGTGIGRRWSLQEQSVTIGRDQECDIVLPDRHVSRVHARISRLGDCYVVEDLGSKNGTHVNGREIVGSHVLRDGDEVQIALRFKLAFVDAGATAPLTFPGAEQAGLRLDTATRQVCVSGRLLDPPLSVAQYQLLKTLAEAEGRIVDRDAVVRAVWSDESEEGVSEQAIDALARRLRERLEELDPEHQYVLTVRGHGFRFVQQGAV